MASNPPTVYHISRATIQSWPLPIPPSAPKRCELTPWDLARLSQHYIQVGLIFSDLPPSCTTDRIIETLKTSLSAALCHFCPVAGSLKADQEIDQENEVAGISLHIDCNGEGAEFIHAIAHDVTVAQVLAPHDDIPPFIHSFFPLSGAVNYDGRFLPLFAIQVTELADGFFLGCAMNHVVGDGASALHFYACWSELARKGVDAILSRPPVLERWFLPGVSPPIKLPFSHEDEFIERYSPPVLRSQMFHFASSTTAQLKRQANEECGTEKISSFQAVCSLIWRAVTRARRLEPEQKTSCMMAMDYRSRLKPPLSPNYFGNSIGRVGPTVSAGELLANGLGWAARRVRESVVSHTDKDARDTLRKWVAAPVVNRLSWFDPCSVMMGGSPRLNAYECDFGWGKPVGLRCGELTQVDGMVMWNPGREGGGSADLEICLAPNAMSALLSDVEFMGNVSPPQDLPALHARI